MRVAHAGLIALTWLMGCVRLGYDAHRAPVDAGSPASRQDAAVTRENDAAVQDAAVQDAAPGMDAAFTPDARMSDDAGSSVDAERPDPGEAGPMDSGKPGKDSADDSGEPDLCPERFDALFCDGFEDAALSRWSYNVVRNGSVNRTTTRSRSGEGSLRAATGAAGATSNARYGAKIFDNQKSGDIWVRYFYYLPTSTVINTSFSSGVVNEIEPPYVGFALFIRPQGLDIAVGDNFYRGSGTFPRDRWTCVELHARIDATSGVLEAYLDGALVVQTPETDTLPDMGYTSLDVGIHYTDPGQGPVEVFVDDVVAGTARIGCD